MAVDRKARMALRDAIVGYMLGKIRSFEFDDEIDVLRDKKSTSDQSVCEIAKFLWSTYDGTVDHSISLTSQGWEKYRRILEFLSTDLEIERTQDDDAWPFRDHEEWLQKEDDLDALNLPQYDPVIHGGYVHPWWDRIPSRVGFAILGAIVLAVMAFLLLER